VPGPPAEVPQLSESTGPERQESPCPDQTLAGELQDPLRTADGWRTGSGGGATSDGEPPGVHRGRHLSPVIRCCSGLIVGIAPAEVHRHPTERLDGSQVIIRFDAVSDPLAVFVYPGVSLAEHVFAGGGQT